MSITPPIRLMIVDDSAVIRGMLQRTIAEQPDIEIVGTAGNGLLAIEQLKKTPADIITLDIEMPHMDGISALPELLKLSPKTRIIMVSTLTQRNASISFKALGLGASDYICKPSSQNEDEIKQFFRELLEKVRALAPCPQPQPKPSVTAKVEPAIIKPVMPSLMPVKTYPKAPVRAIAIGSSTGGPQALAVVFKGLASRFPNIPVFVTQHMPPKFTTILADHIKQICGRPCAEGKEGEVVAAGSVYIAPGDFHMQPEKVDGKVIIRLNQNPQVNFCRPAVDPMLQSLTKIYGGNLLVAILTGMGSDGLGGAKDVVAAGGTVVAQDQETCVVWGMPRAVTEHNICSAILPLDDVAPYLLKACS
jgi:two-component system, chemotaxis family, protein-glutamate methylesterase/glutaminase